MNRPLLDLNTVYLKGTAADMGSSYGSQLAPAIQAFVAQRMRASAAYLWEHGCRDQGRMRDLGAQCHALFTDWDPLGAAEHDATAVAAGVDPVDLYTASNMTDIRDILLVEVAADQEGCSALLLPASRCAEQAILVGQTWDLNPQDVEDIVAVHRCSPGQPASWSITCNGCPSLVAINEAGLAVGTTNIKTDDAGIGVGYLSLLHRAIRCESAREAAAVIAEAPRAAAHTYWLADSQEARLLTCSARRLHEERLSSKDGLAQTNHLRYQLAGTASLEEASSSSCTRLQHLQGWMAQAQAVRPEDLRQLFADRSHGMDSINRYPEDQTGSATDACFIALPAQAQAWACRGPADRGRWYQLTPGKGQALPA